jgi:hypothetical protein
MKAATKRNFIEWIERNPQLFPTDFKFEDFENFGYSLKEEVFRKLGKAAGWPRFDYQLHTMPKSDFKAIDGLISAGSFEFSKTVFNRMKRVVDKRIEKEQEIITRALEKQKPKPTWAEIPQPQQNNFRRWVVNHAKDYDEKFTGPLFDKLSDEIKLEFYFELAKKFGVQDYYELRTFKRSSNDMNMGVKKLKITDEIQEAIYDVIPVDTGILKTIKKSEMDNWDAQEGVAKADSYTQEEIDAAREKRKFDKKRAKMIARVKSMKSLEQYNTTMSDDLFDRGMFEIILDRMDKGTAFKDTWYDQDSKEIIKLIVNHPMATTNDLMRIKKMKTTQWGGKSTARYNSSHLNTALAQKNDAPMTEVMKLIKLQQYDLKVNAMKRQDLSDADRDIIIEYTIKQHSHMPAQLKEIFKAGNKEDLLEKSEYKSRIIAEIKKKYTKGSGWASKPNGMKFLVVMDEYGWFDELTDKDKTDMVIVISKAYQEKRISKERIVKMIDKISDQATEFFALLYEETGEEDFLPKTIQDMFLF